MLPGFGFRSPSPRFRSPTANPKTIFYIKGVLVEEPHCLPLPSLMGKEVLQPPEPKYSFASMHRAMQIPSFQGQTLLTCSLGEEQLAKRSTSEQLPWWSKGHKSNFQGGIMPLRRGACLPRGSVATTRDAAQWQGGSPRPRSAHSILLGKPGRKWEQP